MFSDYLINELVDDSIGSVDPSSFPVVKDIVESFNDFLISEQLKSLKELKGKLLKESKDNSSVFKQIADINNYLKDKDDEKEAPKTAVIDVDSKELKDWFVNYINNAEFATPSSVDTKVSQFQNELAKNNRIVVDIDVTTDKNEITGKKGKLSIKIAKFLFNKELNEDISENIKKDISGVIFEYMKERF